MPTVPIVDDVFGVPDQTALSGDRCGMLDRPLVTTVCFGHWRVPARFFSPNRRGLTRIPELYVCDRCGRDYITETSFTVHQAMCSAGIYGREVYRDEERALIICEARGIDESCAPACQRFCLLAKHFLDHKESFLDMESFVFYLLFRVGSDGLHFAGYFSKECVTPNTSTNLSCIAVLPPYQKQGLGGLLIHVAYELSRRQGRPGTPERPMTAQGRRAFSAVWCGLVATALVDRGQARERQASIAEISGDTGMIDTDVLATLLALGALARRDDGNSTPAFALSVTDALVAWSEHRPAVPLDPVKLHV